jgi:hypothetical protein
VREPRLRRLPPEAPQVSEIICIRPVEPVSRKAPLAPGERPRSPHSKQLNPSPARDQYKKHPASVVREPRLRRLPPGNAASRRAERAPLRTRSTQSRPTPSKTRPGSPHSKQLNPSPTRDQYKKHSASAEGNEIRGDGIHFGTLGTHRPKVPPARFTPQQAADALEMRKSTH